MGNTSSYEKKPSEPYELTTRRIVAVFAVAGTAIFGGMAAWNAGSAHGDRIDAASNYRARNMGAGDAYYARADHHDRKAQGALLGFTVYTAVAGACVLGLDRSKEGGAVLSKSSHAGQQPPESFSASEAPSLAVETPHQSEGTDKKSRFAVLVEESGFSEAATDKYLSS